MVSIAISLLILLLLNVDLSVAISPSLCSGTASTAGKRFIVSLGFVSGHTKKARRGQFASHDPKLLDLAEDRHFYWLDRTLRVHGRLSGQVSRTLDDGGPLLNESIPHSDNTLQAAIVHNRMRIGDDFRGYLISFQGFPACQSFLGGISELDTQANGLSTGLASEADLRVVAIVQTVEEDAHASLAAVQTNPPWGLDRVDQKRLPLDRLFHPRSVLREIDVYIVDTGIRIDHADFEGRAVWGVTTRTGSPDMDDNGHGSHVAGIVGGRFAGVSKSSNLIAIKALDEEGRGPYSELIAGLQWVADRVSQQPSRPAVVNLSVQGRESDILQSAIKALSNLGVHVVAAAGNKGQPSCNFSPASTTPNTPLISVGAIDRYDVVAKFSNYGRCTTLLAPGVGVTSVDAFTEEGFKELSGTSMAAPHVTGTIAAILGSTLRNYSPSEVKNLLTRTALYDVAMEIDDETGRIGLVQYAPMLYSSVV